MSYVNDPRRPFRFPLPMQQVGLGDVIARATQAVGIKPCPPCKRRQAYLNRLLVLGRRGG